ncbi:MAG: Transcription-repair coupling factor [Candidatus Kaiserbacteria bacterium GW2011_GWA2_49_19]|uniref:Transcription-repair coupling factor n=1 Tax=Candidatus Kaiserbacteria bacterium GW2011_GWA2_49_19 TaxID=1618669 RepID=A0A0G1VP30_9BACT|nr:MAG: Transcription-repair coupling factor [Candidatus Kaiserbacteria bacterium GW2011_GWA2_49_19]
MGQRQILIVSLAPYFLKRGVLWFEKNREKIQRLNETQSWWQNHCLFLAKDKVTSLSALLQKLIDFGYEKTQTVTFPGELSQRGGLIDVFPVNSRRAFRIEFFGNRIETIEELNVTVPEEKKVRRILEAKLKSQKLFSGLKDLRPGDYLVHLDHGVAKFTGVRTMEQQAINNEQLYYVLEYAQEDKLYVPLGLERKLSRYIGFTEPKISRLGSTAWQKTKRKIKEGVEKFAKELLQVYARREIALRPSYSHDDELETILESTFPYQETPDQLQAWAEIKKDLNGPKPMDRLLCGDVGFGKTEIALRTIILAVSAGYQAALLCPTTILAHQHFQNFRERLKNLPINPALLTRLQTKKEQREIVEKIKQGKIDIVIGTHRLLSKDIEFAQPQGSKRGLGLLVIDDEQRFGVRQKEKLKKMRAAIDILSLSATPIPRTLYLSLSSLREMSLIQTPPQGRLPIKTFILPWSLAMIKRAVRKEIERKGQIYYLHNRVATIGKTKDSLGQLLPQIKIGVVHGRMKEKELMNQMTLFQSGQTDLLLATTIIENGLDLPNVNTLIIEDASRLGLSQAYQIRGRVGRFSKQAFAYLFHPQKLSPIAKERLQALKGAESLGSGWQIAIKDLEIRGAGNILGKEQSGSVNQVGLNLYCQMLSEAVTKQKPD